MFKLGEMFVQFTGKDGGLAKLVKLADNSGKRLQSVFQAAMKEGGKIGVAAVQSFQKIAIASAKASTIVAKSFERMVASSTKAAARIAPAMMKSFDRMVGHGAKFGTQIVKSFERLGLGAMKAVGPIGNTIVKGIGGAMSSAATAAASGATAIAGSLGIITIAAGAMYVALTAGIGLLASLGASGAGIAYMTNLASSAQEVNSKFDVVFGSSGPKAVSELEKLASAAGRSKQDLKGMAAGIQDLLVPIGFARDKAADMSVKISQLAVDMASFNNKSDEETIEDISAALAGSGEVMKKYGVILNDVTMKQELSRMGYKGTVQDADEQLKALARLNIIIAGTSDAHGDAVRTGGSFSNQMKRIMGIINDIAIKIGNIFLPAAEVFAQFFSKHLSNVSQAADSLSGYGAIFKQWAENIVLWLDRIIVLFTNWGELSGKVQGVIAGMMQTVWNAITTTFNNIGIAIATFGENLFNVFPALSEAIAENHQSLWGFLEKGWNELWDFISSGGTDAIDINIEEMLASISKKMKSPKFKTIDNSAFTKSWDSLITAIDSKLGEQTAKAEALGKIEAFDPQKMGVEVKQKIKFDLTDAAGFFKKSLEDAFKDRDDDKTKETKVFQEKQVGLAQDHLKVARDTNKKLDALSDKLGAPIFT